MKIPIKLVRTVAAVSLLAGAPVFAGSFTTDFSPGSTGYTLAGTSTPPAPPGGYLTNYAGVNRAVLAPNASISAGSVTVWDSALDNSQAIESFVANFKLLMGPGSADAADGVSFNFGPDITDGLVSNEEGPGGTAVTVSFDIYDNGVANEFGAPSTPAVDILFGGVVIASHAYAKADMVTSQLEDVSIRLTRAGKVSVVYKGEIIHTNVFIPGWAPTKGLFNLSSRSSGESCEQEVANLSINTVLQGAAVAPTILTNPANATVNERGSTNFTVVVDGTAPFSFQWTDNGADISGANGVTFTMGPIPYTENNHLIRARVTNPANPTTGVTSGAATLTVIRDTTPPTVLRANANMSGTMVTVVYSEPVTDTALDVANYGIDQGGTINSASRLDASRVILNMPPGSPLPGGLSFILSIHGVQDTASSPPNTIAPTQVPFRTYVFQVGAATHKMYNGFDDNHGTLADLQADPRYPNNPDRQDIMTRFEYPANGINVDPADPIQDYTDTLECYFIPPTTNDYVFYVAASDINDLYLSTDVDPVNMVMIAHLNFDWTNPRGWMEPQCDTTNTNGMRSDWFTGNMWPGAGDPASGNALIHLDGGQRYYMFAVHHCFSWSGEGDFAVTYTYAGASPPAAGDAPLLTGSVIGNYLDPTGASVTFSEQPTSVTILDGGTATFTGLATGQSLYGTNVVTYQWQSAPKGSSTFTDIPGETLNSYTTPVLHVPDSGTQYKLLAMLAGLVQPSSVATVTVTAETVPTLTITRNSDGTFTLTYTGTLYSSPTVTGTYNPVSGASNPWTVNPKPTSAPAAQYYRAGP